MNIDISSAENFYHSYHQYCLNFFKIDFNLPKIYKYVFFCRDSDEIYCLEGGCIEEIYYKILFKINYNSCDDIYVYLGSEYNVDILNNPIELLKTHYFENDNNMYIFEEIKFIQSNLENETINCEKISINKKSSEEFYESYKLYYQYKILSKIKSKIISRTSNDKYQYILVSKEFADIYFIEGYSIEELYYIILFKIDNKCWDNVFDCNYPMNELKNPLKLFKKHFLESDEYIFEQIAYE